MEQLIEPLTYEYCCSTTSSISECPESSITDIDFIHNHIINSDSLLNLILPPHVAEIALGGRPIEPERFENACIFFSDIAGFTEISASMDPNEVMILLDRLYLVLDFIVKLFPDLYKVETIGDSMMVCSGCTNDPSYTNPEVNISEFACLAMRMVKELFQQSNSVKLRMGIHQGPVCGGIVGSVMPRYCFFGDVVNTASRMESTSESGKIHISHAMNVSLSQHGERFALSKLAPRDIKSKGVMETCWLESSSKSDNPEYTSALLNDLRSLLGPNSLTHKRKIAFNFGHRQDSSLVKRSHKEAKTKYFSNIPSLQTSLDATSHSSSEGKEYDVLLVTASKLHRTLICSLLKQAQNEAHSPFEIALTIVSTHGLEVAMKNEGRRSLIIVDLSTLTTLHPVTVIRSSSSNSNVPIVCLFSELVTHKPVFNDVLTAFWPFLPANEDMFIKMLIDALENCNVASFKPSATDSEPISLVYPSLPKPKVAKRALLVEDSSVQLKVISAALVSIFAMADITLCITAATTGERARELLAMQIPFDFAVIDENLSHSVLQGSAIVPLVLAVCSDVYVIALIGNYARNSLRMHNAGADIIWSKPLRRGHETLRRFQKLGIIPR